MYARTLYRYNKRTLIYYSGNRNKKGGYTNGV